MAELEDAAAALRSELERGGDSSDEFAELQRVVGNVLGDVSQATGEQRAELVALGRAYLDAGENAIAAAQDFNQAAASRAAADANLGRFDKTGQRVGAVNPLSVTDFNARFGWEETFSFPKERTPRRPRKTDEERAAESLNDLFRSQEEDIARSRVELMLIGQSETVRDRVIAQLTSEQEIRRRGIDQFSNEAQKIRQNTLLLAENEAQLRRQENAWGEVAAVTESAIDTLVDSAANGFEDIGDALTGVAQDLTKFSLEMGLANPLKNWLTGSEAPTFGDIGQVGGALGRMFGRQGSDTPEILSSALGQSVGAMNVQAAVVNINGGSVSAGTGGLMSLFGSGASAASMAAISPKAAADIASGVWGAFDTGGWTGDGDKYEPAGIVHRGEYVVSAAATRAIGVRNLDAMHRAAKRGGFAEGGHVAPDFAPGGSRSSGWGGAGGDTVQIFPPAGVETTKRRKKNSRGGFDTQIIQRMVKEEMADGGYDDVMRSRWGSSPVRSQRGSLG